ncbi:MAG: ABC transporter permease [Thermoplasmata archaeon]|nr:ABC transporter permease [Thermoplasmata archaeon]
MPSSSAYYIGEDVSKAFPFRFRGDRLLAVVNGTVSEYSYPSMALLSSTPLSFRPVYYSNLWDAWSSGNTMGEMYYAMADERNVSVYAKIPPDQSIGETSERTYLATVNLSAYPVLENASIVGSPVLIYLPSLENGSLIVLPLDTGVAALSLEGHGDGGGQGVGVGDVVWFTSYGNLSDVVGSVVEPAPVRPITLYKENPSETEGKERIILAGRDGRIFSLYRCNGTLEWWSTITAAGLRNPEVDAVCPTLRGEALITGTSEGMGFVASISPATGLVNGNGSWVFTFPSRMTGQPGYVPSSRNYVFSNDEGNIYILTENMELDASFSVPGTAATPAVYLGNILSVGSSAGNYFGVITKDGSLYVQSITGNYIAPLPPGKYPSGNTYILGTDVFGHDIFTNLIYATRIELVVGIVAAVLSAGLGTLVGLLAGYFGGWVDTILMRTTDIFLTLPVLVVALLLVAVLGPSIFNIILIIAIFSWAGVARVIRSQALSLKNRSFVDAARVSGAGNFTIIFRHLAPNVLPLTFLYMVFTISGAIITEAILAFLGMGDQTAITWGMMLQYLRISGNTLTAPWWLLPPGISITLFSLAFYLIGRAFDEVVNPRLRSR